MSELRSAIDELRSETLSEMPDARIEEDFSELHRAIEQLELERLRRLAEIDRRRLYERDGHLSAASWLARAHRLGWGAAREQVKTARALEEMAKTRKALEDDEVSLSAAKVLIGARDAEPEAFARSESELVEAARVHSVSELQKVCAFWRQRAERERFLDPEERLRERRFLHASVTFGGMVRVDGDLDPETGETLLTALGAVLDAEGRGREKDDRRSPAQRRVDALGEVCRQWLDRADRPSVGGERPHMTVTVSAETLAGDAVAEFDRSGPIPEPVTRRLACDASVLRVVMNARSEPLDVGRRTPVIPPSMRRGVIARDRRCRFPGCDRPHPWCDAHHVRHWADGGPTAASNLLLLCRRHHRLIHRPRGFTLEVIDGRPVFRRPDGSILEDRAPP
jgi:Domain of unknown function (DUF222)/HNH endonuclease